MKTIEVIEPGSSHYAPEIDSDKMQALAKATEMPCVLHVRFHSDMPLGSLDERDIRFLQKVEYAYDTTRWGEVYGFAYAIPCRPAEEVDSDGYEVYIDENGRKFAIDVIAGTSECPCRIWLYDPLMCRKKQ